MTETSFSKGHLEDEIDKISSLIAGAGRLLAEHKPVDLALLEDRVQSLCTDITGAPAEVAKPLAGRLGEILGMLDSLETALVSEYGPMTKLAEQDAREQAARSYPPSGPPSGPSEKDPKKS